MILNNSILNVNPPGPNQRNCQNDDEGEAIPSCFDYMRLRIQFDYYYESPNIFTSNITKPLICFRTCHQHQYYADAVHKSGTTSAISMLFLGGSFSDAKVVVYGLGSTAIYPIADGSTSK